jgi:hypothetical protein
METDFAQKEMDFFGHILLKERVFGPTLGSCKPY